MLKKSPCYISIQKGQKPDLLTDIKGEFSHCTSIYNESGYPIDSYFHSIQLGFFKYNKKRYLENSR